MAHEFFDNFNKKIQQNCHARKVSNFMNFQDEMLHLFFSQKRSSEAKVLSLKIEKRCFTCYNKNEKFISIGDKDFLKFNVRFHLSR